MDISTLLSALGVSAKYGAGIVASAAILAAVLPQPAPGAWWAPLRSLIDLLGQNFGHAVNSPAAPASNQGNRA